MISIVIPFYNEEDNIDMYEERLFPVVDEISKRYNEEFNYIFIDDGSVDNTLVKLNEIAESNSSVKVIPHVKNKGLGAALKTGTDAADGDFVVLLDSDLTYRPKDITILFDAMKQCSDCDCISGSPYMKGDLTKDVSFIRLLPSKIVNLLYRLILGEKISCFSGMFRLYRRDVFDRISIESTDYQVCAEILAKMILAGMKIVEVPVELHTREFGESKLDVKKETINNIKLLYRIFCVKYFNKSWS